MLHVKFRVGGMRPSNSKPGWGIVIIPGELINQKSEIVQHGERELMVPRRPTVSTA
jgi:acyl dehydratase